MMRSLFSGVSGLKVHQTRMDNIGNNIANVNTVGFKSTRTTFSDMLSQTQSGASTPTDELGGTNPKQIGLGVQIASMDLIFTDGSAQTTGKNTDLALSGNGLFVVKNGDNTYYTRDGAFEFDSAGNLVLPGSGLLVQGWNEQNGSINTNAQPTTINVPIGKTMEATQTTQVSFVGTLDATDKVIDQVNATTFTDSSAVPGSLTGVTYASATAQAGSQVALRYENGDQETIITGGTFRVGDTYPQPTVIDVYDSLGNIHKVTMQFERVTYQQTIMDLAGDDGLKALLDQIRENDSSTYIYDTDAVAQADPSKVNTFTSASKIANTWMITLVDTEDGSWDGNLEFISSSDDARVQMAPVFVSFDSDGNYIGVVQNRRYWSYLTGGSDSGLTRTVEDATTHSYTYGNPTDSLTFDTNESDSEMKQGLLSLIYSPANGASDQTYMAFNGNSEIISNTGLSSDPDTGVAKDYRVNLNFSGSGESTLVQVASGETDENTSNLRLLSDGNIAGQLTSVSFDTSGIITGVYSNGKRQFEAQVAIAQFTNSAGLTKMGNSLYQESNNSGTANVKTASVLGVSITPSALEMSNVDLANEFSEMIITQRGFQANSKIINVGDEMLETLVNMKR